MGALEVIQYPLSLHWQWIGHTRGTLDNLGVALIVVPVRILLQTVPHVVGVEKDGEDNDATGQTNHNGRSSVGPRRCRAFGVLVLR